MKNQTSIISGEEKYCDQLYQKHLKSLGEEEQGSDQHQAKQKYHFRHVREQFHENEICDMQTEILT